MARANLEHGDRGVAPVKRAFQDPGGASGGVSYSRRMNLMGSDDPGPDALRRLRDGDPAAAELLFALYARRLTRVAEQHLAAGLAGRLDGADVVQSVFRTFFRRGAAGEFSIDSSADLWRLLATITLRKVAAKARHHRAGIRDVGAETSGRARLAEAVVRDPGPDEAAALADQIVALLRGLPPLYGQVLELRLQGHGATEAAGKLGVSRQTVHRVLRLLRQRLEAAERDDARPEPGQ